MPKIVTRAVTNDSTQVLVGVEQNIGKSSKKGSTCDLRGQRKLALQRTWADADRLSSQGAPVGPSAWGFLLRRNWKVIKEESKNCPQLSEHQIEALLVSEDESRKTDSESG